MEASIALPIAQLTECNAFVRIGTAVFRRMPSYTDTASYGTAYVHILLQDARQRTVPCGAAARRTATPPVCMNLKGH